MVSSTTILSVPLIDDFLRRRIEATGPTTPQALAATLTIEGLSYETLATWSAEDQAAVRQYRKLRHIVRIQRIARAMNPPAPPSKRVPLLAVSAVEKLSDTLREQADYWEQQGKTADNEGRYIGWGIAEGIRLGILLARREVLTLLGPPPSTKEST